MPFEKILFPVDFSEASEEMAADVITMARQFEASVTVLHAFNRVDEHDLAPSVDAPFGPEPGAIPYTPEVKRQREAQQALLDDFVRAHFSERGIRAKALLEDGDPAKAIEWTAKQEQSGLAMIAAEEKGALRQILLGSLTAKVLNSLECPVYTRTHGREQAAASPDGFRNILCAVKMEAESEPVLKMAGLLARAFGSQVCLLQVRAKGEDAGAGAMDAQESFKKALGSESGGTMAMRVRVVEAEVPEAVREAAREEAADLVVVGRDSARATLTRFWSNLYSILRESPCPVLSV
jgi:nucleotide-binding universal stress UspA family protein